MDGSEGWNQMSMTIGPIPGYFWPLHRQFIVRKTAPLQVKKWTQPTAAALKPSPHDKEMVCSSWYILWKHAEIKWLCVPAQHESASSGHYIGNYIVRPRSGYSYGHYIGNYIVREKKIQCNDGPNQQLQHSNQDAHHSKSLCCVPNGWYWCMEPTEYVDRPNIRL